MNANPGTFVNDAGEPVMWYGPSNLSPASAEFEAVVRDRLAKIEEAHPEMRGRARAERSCDVLRFGF